jgi:hypothetical protein
MKGNIMNLRTCTLGLALLASAAFLPTYSFAIEPDVDNPAGPQLAKPTDRPDFQQDDQTGAAMNPQAEGANPSPSTAEGAVPMTPDAAAGPDVIITDRAPSDSAVETSPGEENKSKPKVE